MLWIKEFNPLTVFLQTCEKGLQMTIKGQILYNGKLNGVVNMESIPDIRAFNGDQS